MTYNLLSEIMNQYNIPGNVHFMSDSGWECDATEMNGIYYNRKTNTIVFTQVYAKKYSDSDEWELLYIDKAILDDLY